jgi:hypothetical protein
MYQQQHHHHHHSTGAGNGSNISVPDRRIAGPVAVIVVIAAMFLSASGAEDFSHGYVVFNACLAGALIALTIAGSVVSALRRPHRIRLAEEKARAETALAYTGRVESNTSMVGATTPNVVAFALTIRCGDGNLVKVMLPYVTGSGKFQVGHQVIKRAGERWPVDVSPRGYMAQP